MREFIEVARDLVIITFFVLGIAMASVALVLTVSIYRKVGPILESLRTVLTSAQATTAMFSDLALKPLIRASSFFAGVRRGISVLRRLQRWKGGR